MTGSQVIEEMRKKGCRITKQRKQLEEMNVIRRIERIEVVR